MTSEAWGAIALGLSMLAYGLAVLSFYLGGVQ